MAAILTAAEMRALERAAIESGAVTGLELMERAGRGVVEAILAEWPGIEDGAKRAVVLCGPGHNGGDGFVVARLLKERGWEVEAFLYGDAKRLPADARTSHDRLAAAGASIRPLDLDDTDPLFDEGAEQPDLWIDAIFGIGLKRRIDPRLATFLGHLALSFDTVPDRDRGRLVCIDVPSGLDADAGLPLVEPNDDKVPLYIGHGVVWQADLTVTFQALKPGHLLAAGPYTCRKVIVADIGLSVRNRSVWDCGDPWRKQGVRKHGGHKYDHGHAVVLSGGCGRGGAARLAARGALRVGAGLVTLAVPAAALQENAAALTAIMLRSIRGPEALADYLGDPRLNAISVGPGFGTGEREAALIHALFDALEPERRANDDAHAAYVGRLYPDRDVDEALMRGIGRLIRDRGIVLDADALTLLARDEALRGKLHAACVLTPHEGEFARLCPAIDARWRAPATAGPAFSKVDAAREAAASLGCVVLLKGPDTVVADPSGRAAINAAAYERAAPWLATAGSGDVLAGMITGLLARGLPPFDAACTAAWLHVECARSFGPGLIAEDLPEELPRVFRALGL